MIKLNVRKYCGRCPHFEPEVAERPKVDILTSYDFCAMEDKRMAITHGDTIVKCCNRDRCEAIYEYMEGLVKNRKENNDGNGKEMW